MLTNIWVMGLLVVAVVAAARFWWYNDVNHPQDDALQRGIASVGVSFFACLFAVTLRDDLLGLELAQWWADMLPEPGTGINIATAGLLTLASWAVFFVIVMLTGGALNLAVRRLRGACRGAAGQAGC
ncbi:hypothetical protein [Cupriavidus pampae]|uniref:Uncharacterized protein n=1 Tax=Cupriavidus pampae TaxID=659251 RepID=A0ABM8XUA9_9BURK|nr:hypothetical protein [Cupriavidus pampae]CAG9183931.1 hypothetical protein LMG32289_05465 [Cupriavidus pampae]